MCSLFIEFYLLNFSDLRINADVLVSYFGRGEVTAGGWAVGGGRWGGEDDGWG